MTTARFSSLFPAGLVAAFLTPAPPGAQIPAPLNDPPNAGNIFSLRRGGVGGGRDGEVDRQEWKGACPLTAGQSGRPDSPRRRPAAIFVLCSTEPEA
ncbi:MAG: hypothetical protein ABL963_03445 [Longimicrobiales bacterium]